MSTAAIQTVKKFRLQQLNGLPSYVARYGPLKQSDSLQSTLPNPFLPRFNPNTGKWHPPRYSLRRQAELIKKAKSANTLHLLPPGPKLLSPIGPASSVSSQTLEETSLTERSKSEEAVWSAPIEWDGKLATRDVPGIETGSRLYTAKKRMFKGHKWERVKEKRKIKRQILMRDMAKRIANYKAYYHRRKPNPLKPARTAKAPKLPF